jgi:hypothetical protein
MTVDQKSGFIGLATNVGRLNAPPGALDVANNVVIRKPGVIEPRPGCTQVGLTGEPASVTVNKIWEYDGKIHVLASGTWRQYLSATKRTLVNTAGSTIDPALFRNDLVPIAQARGNCYVGTQKGVLKLTGSSVTSFVESGALCPFAVSAVGSAAGTPAAVATATKVAYRVVLKRTDANGLVTRSIPSASAEYSNTSGATRDVVLNIYKPTSAAFYGSFQLAATDEIEVYRTRAFPTASTIDEEYALVGTRPGFTTNYEQFTDRLTDSQRGAIGYWCPSQGGAISENQRAPATGCTELFKGHLFFGNTVGPFRKTISTSTISTVDIGPVATGIGARVQAGGGNTTIGSPLITALADTTGVQAGMIVGMNDTFPVDTYVLSVDSANQVTVSANAIANRVAYALIFVDAIQVGGEWKPVFAMAEGAAHVLVTPVVSGVSAMVDGVLDANPSTTYFARSITPATPPYAYTFVIEELTRSLPSATSYIRATHGNEYYPAIVLYGDPITEMDRDVFPDGVAWSKKDEPEHVPPLNYARVGDKKKALLGLACTRDSLFIIKEDGIWRLSGSGGNGASAWRIDPFDLTTFCVLPQSIQKLNNRIYFLSNKGVVRLSEKGVEVLSMPINDEVKRVVAGCLTRYATDGYYSIDTTANHSSAVNEIDSEYMLSIAETADRLSGVLVYNELTNTWVTWSFPVPDSTQGFAATYPSAMGWSGALRSVMLGTTDGHTWLKRLTSPEEVSPANPELQARDDFYLAVSISSAVLISGNNYTVVYTPASQGDVLVDSDGVAWKITARASSTSVTVGLNQATTHAAPVTGAGAFVLQSVESTVRAKPFIAPAPMQKLWTTLQAGFATLVGAVITKITCLSNVKNTSDDATAQHAAVPGGVSYIDGYAVAHRGNLYKINVPRDHARALAVADGVEVSTAFGHWELESLSATSTPMGLDKPTIAQTGSVAT